jgi:hypothetical protein
LTSANKKTVLVSAGAILFLVLVTLFSTGIAWTQSNNTFWNNDIFAIPMLNGNIKFTLNGTYYEASLENTTWVFQNLQDENSLAPLNLRVSVQNCNVTITSCRTYNGTVPITSLQYTVEGQGVQSFKLSPLQRGGEWSVTFNRSFIGENEGWTLSSNGTLAVTNAPSGSNVTLTYFFFPDLLGGNGDNSSVSFFAKHSVVIATGAAVVATLSVTVVITFVSKKSKRNLAVRDSLR